MPLSFYFEIDWIVFYKSLETKTGFVIFSQIRIRPASFWVVMIGRLERSLLFNQFFSVGPEVISDTITKMSRAQLLKVSALSIKKEKSVPWTCW
jgi:hypothetical protein